MLTACQPTPETAARNDAARVNGVGISIDAVKAAVAEVAPSALGTTQEQERLALEGLIAQRVLVNAALDEAVDQEPAIRGALEAARLKILAKAYVDRHVATVPPPSPEAIRGYFDEHPELFAERRLYRLQELAIEASPEQIAQIARQYETIMTLNDMVTWLDANRLRYSTNAAVKAAEDLASDLLPVVARMKDGQTVKVSTDRGITILQVTGVQSAPVTLEAATPVISKFLSNQRAASAIEALTKTLRDKSNVEYLAPLGAQPTSPD